MRTKNKNLHIYLDIENIPFSNIFDILDCVNNSWLTRYSRIFNKKKLIIVSNEAVSNAKFSLKTYEFLTKEMGFQLETHLHNSDTKNASDNIILDLVSKTNKTINDYYLLITQDKEFIQRYINILANTDAFFDIILPNLTNNTSKLNFDIFKNTPYYLNWYTESTWSNIMPIKLKQEIGSFLNELNKLFNFNKYLNIEHSRSNRLISHFVYKNLTLNNFLNNEEEYFLVSILEEDKINVVEKIMSAYITPIKDKYSNEIEELKETEVYKTLTPTRQKYEEYLHKRYAHIINKKKSLKTDREKVEKERAGE